MDSFVVLHFIGLIPTLTVVTVVIDIRTCVALEKQKRPKVAKVVKVAMAMALNKFESLVK